MTRTKQTQTKLEVMIAAIPADTPFYVVSPTWETARAIREEVTRVRGLQVTERGSFVAYAKSINPTFNPGGAIPTFNDPELAAFIKDLDKPVPAANE